MLLWYILAFCICLERGLKMPNNKVEKLCKKKKKWHWEKVRDTEIPSILSEMLERHEISRRLTYLLPHYWCSLKQIISNIVAPEVFTYSIHSFRNNLNQNEFGVNQILILVKSFVYSLIYVAVVLIHCVLQFPVVYLAIFVTWWAESASVHKRGSIFAGISGVYLYRIV